MLEGLEEETLADSRNEELFLFFTLLDLEGSNNYIKIGLGIDIQLQY